jgi:hypothetical protein
MNYLQELYEIFICIQTNSFNHKKGNVEKGIYVYLEDERKWIY